jgi:cell division protein FtsL
MVSYIVKPLFVAFLLCGLFGIVWLRSNFISMEYTISELENRKAERLREAKMLMAEKASLMAMHRIEKTAVRDLGLVFPDRTRVVYVKERTQGPQKASLDITAGTRQ